MLKITVVAGLAVLTSSMVSAQITGPPSGAGSGRGKSGSVTAQPQVSSDPADYGATDRLQVVQRPAAFVRGDNPNDPCFVIDWEGKFSEAKKGVPCNLSATPVEGQYDPLPTPDLSVVNAGTRRSVEEFVQMGYQVAKVQEVPASKNVPEVSHKVHMMKFERGENDQVTVRFTRVLNNGTPDIEKPTTRKVGHLVRPTPPAPPPAPAEPGPDLTPIRAGDKQGVVNPPAQKLESFKPSEPPAKPSIVCAKIYLDKDGHWANESTCEQMFDQNYIRECVVKDVCHTEKYGCIPHDCSVGLKYLKDFSPGDFKNAGNVSTTASKAAKVKAAQKAVSKAEVNLRSQRKTKDKNKISAAEKKLADAKSALEKAQSEKADAGDPVEVLGQRSTNRIKEAESISEDKINEEENRWARYTRCVKKDLPNYREATYKIWEAYDSKFTTCSNSLPVGSEAKQKVLSDEASGATK